MQRYVLDTSVFTNPDVYAQFGGDARAAFEGFLRLARESPAELYMPRSVYDELRGMKDLDELAAEFEAVVRIRSPRKYDVLVPGALLYEFIDDMRLRIDRGLRIAEEHARMGLESAAAGGVGAVINRLRERYREALRRGILDSREDADVLLLAFELEAVLVSADEGLRKWADKAGVRLIDPRHLRHALARLVEEEPAPE